MQRNEGLLSFFDWLTDPPSGYMKLLRLNALWLLLSSSGFIALFGFGYLLLRPVRWSVQRAKMVTLVEQANPLISAVEKYVIENTSPPPTLEALIPKYISSIPSTGLDHFPSFQYYVGRRSESSFFGNPWVITATTSRSILNFDMMLYFPNKNYPDTGYGGSLELIEEWA